MEGRFLEIFITPSELGPKLKENILLKPKETYLKKNPRNEDNIYKHERYQQHPTI